MAEFNIECDICGEHFIAKAKQAKYCPACKMKKVKKHIKEQGKINAQKNKTWKTAKPKVPEKKPERKGFVPAKCPDDCLYRQSVSSGEIPMCGFFLITGELRGCDPGKGCKRYVPMKNRTKHRGLTWNEAKGYEMYLKGFSDSEIAKAIKTRASNVKAYRLRVWEAEKHD